MATGYHGVILGMGKDLIKGFVKALIVHDGLKLCSPVSGRRVESLNRVAGKIEAVTVECAF
jgi:hypothetical protein